MASKDQYSATWVSHSSIADFLGCPRAYWLKNVWKRPETNHKVQIVTPPLSLGSAVHEVIEALSVLPTGIRFKEPLVPKFEIAWERFSGKVGGFFDVETEYRYKTRGMEMVRKIEVNPGPLTNLAVKINMELPKFWLSEEDNIILCGKIDWLQYFAETESVGIIDFKTSKKEEDPESLQLPIYVLLAANCQKRPFVSAAYWYLENSDEPKDQKMPDVENAKKKILKIAKEIKLARSLGRLKCPHDGCRKCEPLEKIFRGEAEFVGVNSFGQDFFVLPEQAKDLPDGKVL